jgi:RHS repeat-associated protein
MVEQELEQTRLQRALITGKERDQETGLDYFGARYMSAAQGRFTGPDEPLIDQDPADPQSWNLYAYVRNNPLKYVDLTGNDCIYANNFNTNGTVGIERGNCSQSGGTYVAGTVDINSLSYDANSHSPLCQHD